MLVFWACPLADMYPQQPVDGSPRRYGPNIIFLARQQGYPIRFSSVSVPSSNAKAWSVGIAEMDQAQFNFFDARNDCFVINWDARKTDLYGSLKTSYRNRIQSFLTDRGSSVVLQLTDTLEEVAQKFMTEIANKTVAKMISEYNFNNGTSIT